MYRILLFHYSAIKLFQQKINQNLVYYYNFYFKFDMFLFNFICLVFVAFCILSLTYAVKSENFGVLYTRVRFKTVLFF